MTCRASAVAACKGGELRRNAIFRAPSADVTMPRAFSAPKFTASAQNCRVTAPQSVFAIQRADQPFDARIVLSRDAALFESTFQAS
jgi:hypothetical protein